MSTGYASRADHVFIVVNINRAASSESLRVELERCLDRDDSVPITGRKKKKCFRVPDVTVVCTHSEITDLEEAMRNLRRHDSELKIEIETLAHQIEEAKQNEDTVMAMVHEKR